MCAVPKAVDRGAAGLRRSQGRTVFVDQRSRMVNRKKKAFVDKKNAAIYAILPSHESQSPTVTNTWVRTDATSYANPFTEGDDQETADDRDTLNIATTMGPSSRNEPSEREVKTLTSAEKLDLGLPEDGYDYSRHLKECSPVPKSDDDEDHTCASSSGTLIPYITAKPIETIDEWAEEGSSATEENAELQEVLVALDATCLEQEIAEFESLQDDFLYVANEQLDRRGKLRSTRDVRFGILPRESNTQVHKPIARSDASCLESHPEDDRFLNIMSHYDDSETEVGRDEPGRVAAGEVHEYLRRLTMQQLSTLPDSPKPGSSKHVEPGRALREPSRHETEIPSINPDITNCVHDCESVLSLHNSSAHHPKLLVCVRPKSELLQSSPRRQSRIDITSTDACEDDSSHHIPESSWRSCTTRKGETSEQKKERKAAVKLGRRQARSLKKGIREGFRTVQQTLNASSSRGDVPTSVSVTKL